MYRYMYMYMYMYMYIIGMVFMLIFKRTALARLDTEI